MHDFAILCVEDEEYDVLFLTRALAAAGVSNPLYVAIDGQQAVDYLSGFGIYADRNKYPFPCLILLDLKLPRRSGFEVLEWIRQREDILQPMVIVYTSSSQPKDIERAYKLGANGYLVKRGNPDQLKEMIRVFRDYWLIYNEPPCRSSIDPLNKSVSNSSGQRSA